MLKNILYCVLSSFLFIMLLGTTEAKAEAPGDLFSESVILIDAKSGNILYEKDSNRSMYPASITKIVTAIIAIEEGNLEDIVTVSKNARDQDGSRVYLLEGEKVTLEKLIQGLMINSGNDAGTAIAEHFDGSEKAFAKRMNDFVNENIGVEDTNFVNPHGLFHKDHVTTAKDMAKIAQYAMENDKFREIVSTKEMDWVGEGWETTLFNHHRLLWDYEGTTGVKNGFVPEAGHTLVTSAERDGMELIAVTLNAASKYYSYWDTMSLLDYGFANFITEEIERGEMISDTAGREYMLAKNIFVARQDKETVALKVNKEKDLVVKVGTREHIKEDVLVEQEKSILTPVPSAASSNINGDAGPNGETEAKTSLASTVIIFLSLFLLIFIVGIIQKRKRRKKLQHRYANSLVYSRRNDYNR
ncbi:D-alanyl-D-alanine carboxypeptidase [Sutcliffiella horikoshii]|uniref:D-alanyl-D-alanine carboxypeptidase family protein n=1 Tax=Sutcliffiella horikoshii TaxID=79883 RepID=UPI00203F9768|nr:D-alanyl-D-alanine carboxypeptidase family protein [Sutcliffiella horikoshii]MCM3616488.1 D-alanyl-D-alanine carboxypeptidase [Sutcliffiella horikoshii]